MAVEFLSSFDALRERLTDDARNPFYRRVAWFDLLFRHAMPAQSEPCIVWSSQGFAVPLIRQGAALVSMANYYTPLFAPCGHLPAYEAVTAYDEIFAALRRIRPRANMLHLQPVAAEGSFCAQAKDGMNRSGWLVSDHQCFGNWHLPSKGLAFADYLAARPSALRNTIRRARQRLDRDGHWSLAIHQDTGATLDAAMDAFEAIYQRSWKPAESYPEFIRALCQWAGREGKLRLGVLTRNGQPIASQIWLLDNGVASIVKLAYDPDAANFSPGSVLTAAMMEHALDIDHAIEIDYLSGDDTYKRDWMTHRRQRIGVLGFDPCTVAGLAGAVRHLGGRAVRHLQQRFHSAP